MSDKKAKAKSQNLPRRQRKSRSTKKGARLASQKSSSTTVSGMAKNSRGKNPTQYLADGPISDRRLGRGYRYSGTQLELNVTTTASDSQLFTNGAGVTSSVNSLMLSMVNLGGRIDLTGTLYDRYRIRRLDFEYEPLCSSTQVGGFAMAIVQDANYITESPTDSYALTQQIENSVYGPFREKLRMSYRYDGEDCWYVYTDSATIAGSRQTIQGILVGYPSAGSIGAVSQGVLRVSWVIDFFGAIPTLGLTAFRSLTADERKLALAYVDKLRSDAKSSVEMKDLKPVAVDRSRTLVASGSASGCFTSVAASSVSSGFSAPKLDERYVLVNQGQRQ